MSARATARVVANAHVLNRRIGPPLAATLAATAALHARQLRREITAGQTSHPIASSVLCQLRNAASAATMNMRAAMRVANGGAAT